LKKEKKTELLRIQVIICFRNIHFFILFNKQLFVCFLIQNNKCYFLQSTGPTQFELFKKKSEKILENKEDNVNKVFFNLSVF
jgi:hypothetical protein